MTKDWQNRARSKKSTKSVDAHDNPSHVSSPASCSSPANANGVEGVDEDTKINLNTIFKEI